MDIAASDAESAVRTFLQRTKKLETVDLDATLYAGGVGLDSLETAELSAMLEDEFGHDPFTVSDTMPQTVRDILNYYEGQDRPA